MGSPVVRWQVISPTPEVVSAFYTRVFGWTVTRGNALGYRDVDTGTPLGIPGGVWPAPPGTPGFVQLFMEVQDVAATIASAEAAGGRVIVPRTALPDGDVMAVLHDPTGMSFGLIEKAALS